MNYDFVIINYKHSTQKFTPEETPTHVQKNQGHKTNELCEQLGVVHLVRVLGWDLSSVSRRGLVRRRLCTETTR
jgi:hypothetical protein